MIKKIDKDRRKELEFKASEVLFNNDMYKIPVNLLKIAKNCGIEVLEADFKRMGIENISGAIRYKDNKFSILLNETDSYERKRFTLAHELGHFFLDRDVLVSKRIHIDTLYRCVAAESHYEARMYEEDATLKLTSEHEIDYFAGALLMNPLILKKVYEVENSISELAKIFKVSVSAMTVRLDILGLI